MFSFAVPWWMSLCHYPASIACGNPTEEFVERYTNLSHSSHLHTHVVTPTFFTSLLPTTELETKHSHHNRLSYHKIIYFRWWSPLTIEFSCTALNRLQLLPLLQFDRRPPFLIEAARNNKGLVLQIHFAILQPAHRASTDIIYMR